MSTSEIKLKCILNTMSNFVIFKDKVYDYNGRGRIYSPNKILLDDFKKSESLYLDIINSDFNQFSVLSDFNYKEKSWENLIEYYSKRNNNFNHIEISTYRQLNAKEISAFYRFELSVEISGLKVQAGKYYPLPNHPFDLAIDQMEENKKWQTEYKLMPRPIEERLKSYVVPLAKVDKLIARKITKETKWFGTENEDKLTVNEYTYGLDTHNFNEEVLSIFKEHKLIEVYF